MRSILVRVCWLKVTQQFFDEILKGGEYNFLIPFHDEPKEGLLPTEGLFFVHERQHKSYLVFVVLVDITIYPQIHFAFLDKGFDLLSVTGEGCWFILFMFFSRNGESFFFLGNSFSGKRAEALILGVGGGAWGSGSGCANGDLLGGGSMSSGVELRSSLLSIS